ncbi:MAG: TonB-dependent receptor plug [Bradyrhizobium sp.]|nr:TonB-dependent receptor plug [Bradyrhizobium sp.]
MKKAILLTSCAAAGLIFSQAARAQQAPLKGADSRAPTAPSSGQSSASAELGDIIVTAERRSESLQKTAVPVSAVTGDQLVAAGVSDVNNLSKLVPALVVAQSGGPATNFFLRGVGTFAQSIQRENSIAFNFDGVYIGSPTAPLGTFYDLERVEVLKGPQGTLYGRNATGGSINVLPKRPSLRGIEAEVTAEYGNYDAKKVTGGINIPLGQTLAVRFAGQVVDRDGYLSDGTDDERGAAGRISLLFKPSNDFSATLVGDYFKQWGKGAGGVLQPSSLVPTAPDPTDRIGSSDPRSTAELFLRFPTVRSGAVTVPQADSYNHSENYGVTATIEGNVGFGTLTTIAAYRNSKPDYRSIAFGYPYNGDENNSQMSLEVRLASNSDHRLRYVVGGYMFLENKRGQDSIDQGPIQRTSYYVRQNTDSYAAFGQATYDLMDGFRLVGGIRQSHESKTQNSLFAQATPADPTGSPHPVFGNVTFDRTTFKAGVELDVAPRSLLYANVSTGFKAGGFTLAVTDNSYRPESITAYTVGSKNRFFGNRLQLNVEAFYWNYSDQQITYIGPLQSSPGVYVTSSKTDNVGKSRLYGADVEMRFQLTPNDLLSADLQYLNSKYTSFNYVQLSPSGAAPRVGCSVAPSATVPLNAPAKLFNVDCSGRPGINAPRWSANVGYQHRFALGDYALVASARSRVESGRYLTLEYLEESRQGSFTSTDASLTLEAPGAKWSITGFVNNIEDSTVLSGSSGVRPFLNVTYTSLRPPRTYGVRASFRY